MKKQPETTRRTREAFVEAFWRVLSVRPVDKMTVAEVSGAAGYNRTTFYEYFADIYDLTRAAEDELLTAFRSHMTEKFPGGVAGASEDEVIRSAVGFFDLYGDRIFLLVGENGDPSFFGSFSDQLLPFLFDMTGIGGKYLDYLPAYVASALVGVVREWLRRGRDITRDELAELLVRLIGRGALSAG